jgi:hypothetical protein
MPYEIQKLSNGLYRVENTDTGYVYARGTTLYNAKRQVRYLYALENTLSRLNIEFKRMRRRIRYGYIPSVEYPWNRVSKELKRTYNNMKHWIQSTQHIPSASELRYTILDYEAELKSML